MSQSSASASQAKPKLKSKSGSSWRKVLPYVLAVGSLLAIWQIVAFFLPSYLLPDVPDVFKRLLRSTSTPEFTDGVKSSLFRLLWGYPLACLFGALLGLIGGVSRAFAVYLRSLISILQSIPPITWVPFFAILLGFGNATIITVIVIASFFPMALSVLNATEGVNKTHLELARVLGASKGQLLTKVFAPESLPAFVTGAQVAFGNAWRSLISAEMVGGASIGLGYYSRWRGEVADMEGVLMSILVIGTIAAVLDLVLLEWLKRRLLRYRYVKTGGNE
ncbi:Putative aliphatic sulfonates transport permease protein SsuC [Paenibacillus solanacearum]|uniref:Aliphatic sulfonates transport permease protein SsuC n=1 Tax=Paenibacillus solanacearum TaxID=2048548 RepID=A0A916NR32_9BACL|nr:ABC transporter permease [Paenibacillus solanacearum]CAG7644455.1 Putative aliphatic sulfonates transport permease protein SsuC [Paenibacillus solanacearum]